MNLLNKIEYTQCLLLDKRFDMFEGIKGSFANFGINVNPFLVGDGKLLNEYVYDHIDVPLLPPVTQYSIDYPSWWLRPNTYNAYLSHKKMLEKALEKGVNSVLMLEDDSFIEDDFLEIVENVSPFFDSNEWDMIYFGSYHNNTTTPITEHVVKVNGSGGFHGVLLKTHLIPKLLMLGPIGPFDWIAGKYIHPKYKCFAIHPCIISQKDGYSYVEASNLTKPSRDKL